MTTLTRNDRGEKTLEAKPGLTKRKENAHRVRGKLPEGDVGGGEMGEFEGKTDFRQNEERVSWGNLF